MSSSEDRCEVSKDKREAINSTEGKKGKSKPPLEGVYKDFEVEEAEDNSFTLRTLYT
ncbi:hypothetical protein F2Q69_00059190 [Brassica cretica]|uniref:Uncharacterized protein n=2 Tax=Brassica cretica TaxID=69181 RepID=A0A8S9RKW2_BRACR|nr:hypothetical protein DY000_02053253 [Brassica cretica]KAF3573341.1 hypothetical protein F2Q69_00059190 [Brassica cretica]